MTLGSFEASRHTSVVGRHGLPRKIGRQVSCSSAMVLRDTRALGLRNSQPASAGRELSPKLVHRRTSLSRTASPMRASHSARSRLLFSEAPTPARSSSREPMTTPGNRLRAASVGSRLPRVPLPNESAPRSAHRRLQFPLTEVPCSRSEVQPSVVAQPNNSENERNGAVVVSSGTRAPAESANSQNLVGDITPTARHFGVEQGVGSTAAVHQLPAGLASPSFPPLSPFLSGPSGSVNSAATRYRGAQSRDSFSDSRAISRRVSRPSSELMPARTSGLGEAAQTRHSQHSRTSLPSAAMHATPPSRLSSTLGGSAVNRRPPSLTAPRRFQGSRTQEGSMRILTSAAHRAPGAYFSIDAPIPESFQGITLDPIKFSAERVRRDAAAIVIKYLKMKGFSSMAVTQKDLSQCPSTQQYSEIVKFIVHQIDPAVSEPFVLDEQVITMLKDLGYPLPIVKSHFRSPCTPLTWPQHLASLAWLCALLILDDTVRTSLSQLIFTKHTTRLPVCQLLARIPEPNASEDRSKKVSSVVAQTPRVIGGVVSDVNGKALEDHYLQRSGGARSEPVSSSSVLSGRVAGAQRDGVALGGAGFSFTVDGDHLLGVEGRGIEVCEVSPKAALIRTIQNAYVRHRQGGKRVDEQDLAQLLEEDLVKFRERGATALQEAHANCQAARSAYENEKSKLDAIGGCGLPYVVFPEGAESIETEEGVLWKAAAWVLLTKRIKEEGNVIAKHFTDAARLETRISTAERLILEQRKHIETLKTDCAARDLEVLELEKELEALSLKVKRQVVTADEAQHLLERAETQHKRLGDREHERAQASQFLSKLKSQVLHSRDATESAARACMQAFYSLRIDAIEGGQFLCPIVVTLTLLTPDMTDTLIAARAAPLRATETHAGSLMSSSLDSSASIARIERGEGLSASLEEALTTLCNGVDWDKWKSKVTARLEQLKANVTKTQERVRDTEAILTTTTKATELKHRKKSNTEAAISAILQNIAEEKEKHDALKADWRRNKEAVEHGIESERAAIQKKRDHLRLQLEEMTILRHATSKKLKATQTMNADKIETWVRAMAVEAETVLHRIQKAHKTINKENKTLEALIMVLQNSSGLFQASLKAYETETKDPRCCPVTPRAKDYVARLSSAKDTKRLPSLLASSVTHTVACPSLTQ